MTNFYKSYSTAMDLHIPISNLGAPTNPMVARQLDEFSKLLNQGIKNIEIGTIDPTKFEQIPKQHFDEVRRLAKITDSHVSVHAPLLELSGFPSREGERVWKEEQRESTEQQVYSILERSYELSNGENVPVVFHAGRVTSQEYGVPWDPKTGPKGEGYRMHDVDEKGNFLYDKEGNPKIIPSPYRSIVAVNKDTGEMTPLNYDKKKYKIGQKEPDIWDPFKKLRSLNSVQWDEEKLKIFTHQKNIEELKEKFELKEKQNKAISGTPLINNKGYKEILESNERDLLLLRRHIEEINQRMASDYENVYNKFRHFAKEKDQKDERIQKDLEQMNKLHNEIENKMVELMKERNKLSNEAEKAGDAREKQRLNSEAYEKDNQLFKLSLANSKAIVTTVGALPTPDIWVPVKDFALDKTTDTVANAIAKLYKKLQDEGDGKEKKMPFIALENFFVDTPMSRGEELKKAVLESREKLVKKLEKDCKLTKEKAVKEAEKLIGATWDVGHINNLRKSGYEGEALKKELLKDTQAIADVVKHVHITDNFGFFDSHLAPGMGNVPIREMMEELEKKWTKLEKEGKLHQAPRGIIEAGGFVAEIGQNPTVGILEYFGSPLYKISPSPYFTTAQGTIGHTYSPYFESFIDFPQQHFNLYGSSFTTLPKSVGGQVGGETSRFSGTPNQ